jgi:creatinine amidohydrolase
VSLLPTITTIDVQEQRPEVAVLPVGSFEQHGPYLPLITDTAIASVIVREIGAAYPVLTLPALTIACSHEHGTWPGTVSISARTLIAVIEDIRESLARQGIMKLILVNGHGGNYVLSNIVQEANVSERRMSLFPLGDDWSRARLAAGLASSGHDDMHAGEIETSILLHAQPSLVRPGYEHADHDGGERRFLLTEGMQAYTKSGVIGFPSHATSEKGAAILNSLREDFADHLKILAD